MPAPIRRVAVTGASGLLGGAVARALRASGVTVLSIGRHAGDDIRWNVERSELDAAKLEGTDAVIHFAGAPIAERWTAKRRRAIRESRVQGTLLLANAIASLRVPPRVWLSGSAVGIYGDRGDEILDEHASPGDGFLADVALAWERATAVAEQARVVVTHLRTGVVLAKSGGALPKMMLPFRFGVGGRAGDGRQWLSWIGLHDYVRAVLFLLSHPASGAANLVAPEPVTSAEFARVLGGVLSRPARVPAPAFALRLVFGDMAEQTLLASQRARPDRLLRDAFVFDDPGLAAALRRELA